MVYFEDVHDAPEHQIHHPAVRSVRAKTNSKSFIRRAPKLDYAKPNQRWWIHVECDSDMDLYIFEKKLQGSEIRLVELEDKFYVEDPRIPNSPDMDETTRLAETVIAQLNGATRVLCAHFHGARIENIVELHDDGTGRGIVSYAFAVHGTSEYPAIADFLNGDPAPINSILPTLKSNNDVQEALFHLGAEGNVWANLLQGD